MRSVQRRRVDRWRRQRPARPDDELERLADLLLRRSVRDRPAREYPFHAERQLSRNGDRLDDMSLRPPEAAPPPIPDKVDGRWLTEIMAEAGLTRTERRCVRLLASGLGAAEIAGRTHLSCAHVSRSLRSAWRRLALLVTGDDPFEPRGSWSPRLFHEVYWSEVKRRVYRRPECCPEGRERCKTLGYCPVGYLR